MISKSRILFIISTLDRVGPTNVLFNLIRYLNRDKFDCAVLTLSPEKKSSRLSDFISLGIPIFQVNQNRFFWLFSSARIRKFIKSYNPKILHSHSFRADFEIFRLRGNRLRIATLHADLKDNYCDTYGLLGGYLLALLNFKVLRNFDWVVSCSKQLHTKYMMDFSKSFIFNGIDETEFSVPGPDRINSLKSKLLIQSDKVIFLFIGSFIDRKDPETIIRAFQGMQLKEQSLLILVGDGLLYRILQRRYRHEKLIVFRNFTTGINDFFSVGNVLISASKSEGLPNVVLEAIGTGNNLLLSKIQGHLDIIENIQCEYDLFEIGDVTTLTGLMDKSVKSLMDTAYGRNKQVSLGSFTARNMAENYGDLYELLIRQRFGSAEI
ncbi:MAG: glycosyltransferase [Bacteroidetes bacterium]|nr:glycosyltransferase [Bacteroidota bacterium]